MKVMFLYVWMDLHPCFVRYVYINAVVSIYESVKIGGVIIIIIITIIISSSSSSSSSSKYSEVFQNGAKQYLGHHCFFLSPHWFMRLRY
jgi:hypothetical protein